MKKNSQIHLSIETPTLNKIRQEAQLNDISISELCRRKMRVSLTKVKLQELINDLKNVLP